MMSMKDTTDRGETHISAGFYNDAEDALAVIRTAKLNAQHAIMKEMEKLRDIIASQHDRVVGSQSEDSEIEWERACKNMGDNVETMVDDLAYWTEHDIRAEMEG